METDDKSSRAAAVMTVHVDQTLAAALNAEAQRTGRTTEDVFRERLGIPTGHLVVKVVDITTTLSEQLRAGLVRPGAPWQEVLEAAFGEATRGSSASKP